MRISVLALSVCAAFSLASLARADEATKTAVQHASASSGDRVVCHLISHQGMLLRTTVCKTQKEWEADRQQQEADLATAQYRSYSAPLGR